MAKARDVSSGWKTYEICMEDGTTPVFDTLRGSGALAKPPVTKMAMFQDLGWPEAKSCLKDNNNHRLIVKKEHPIWLLKCKPSCWRLYFYVWEKGKDKRIV